MNSLNIDGNIPTKIQCPNCKKNTTMTHLKQIEMDTQNYFEDITLKNPDDVITPKMTNNMYKIIIKQTNSKFKKQQINSCQTSESILKIYSYYFIDHEKKLGGYTFRIIENMQEFDENGNMEYFSDSLMKKAEDAIKKASELRVLEKYDESIPYYDDALKILPNAEKLFVYSSKGVALRNLKKYDDAIMCYDKSIQHKPDFSRAWNAKGESLKKMGKMNEAYQCFSKINEL